jgi:chromosome segregation ATPase
MLRTFQEPAPASGGDKASSFEANLLQWVKDTLADYKDINLSDGFKSECWASGKALLALLDVYDSNILNGSYSSIDASQKLPNCEKALKLAEDHVKLPSGLIEPDELANGTVSEKNLVLYLSLFYNSFKDKSASNTKESLEKRLKDLEEKVRFYEEENANLATLQNTLFIQEKTLSDNYSEVTEKKESLLHLKEEFETELVSLTETFTEEKSTMHCKVDELNEEIKVLKSSADSSTTSLQNEKDAITKERDSLKEELRSTQDKLTKEIDEIVSKNEELSTNLKRVNRSREELEEIMKQQEKNHNKTISALRKHVLRHIRDMQVWKGYLESDREYEVLSLTLISNEQCEKLEYSQQINEIDKALILDNMRLEKLIGEREIEVREVVSVNIGKKKKRIKKDDPLIDKVEKVDKIDLSKASKKGGAPKSARASGSARPPKKVKK